MLMCWAANPEERPSFVGLSGIFNTVLGNRSVRRLSYILFLGEIGNCLTIVVIIHVSNRSLFSSLLRFVSESA